MAGKVMRRKLTRGPNKGKTVLVKRTKGGNFYPLRTKGGRIRLAGGGSVAPSRKLARGRQGGSRKRRKR